MKRNVVSGLLVLSLCSLNASFAATNYSYQPAQMQPVFNSDYNQLPVQYPQNNTLRGNIIMVPAGATFKSMLTSNISSETAVCGQTVTLALNNDFYYSNQLIAPAGSTVYGTVIEVSKAKRGGINGRLCIRFNYIYTPYGTQIPISAVIKTDDGSGVLVGGTKMDVTMDYAKDVAAGSAAGALSGLVFGALAGGNVGRGAALGTAVGAGSGLVKSAWDKGKDVEIPANAAIDLMITQPMPVSTSPYLNEN